MINKIQIYISKIFDPYMNLAIEKYLLDSTPKNCCTLYLWQNDNTVVIGRNQNPWAECNCDLLSNQGGRIARRLSGGGAVYHDLGNLNFTFLCSQDNYNLNKNMQVIQRACSLAGIETEISGRNDILADGRKFSGNAFYNSKGKSYHHGTLLINSNIENMVKYLTPPKAKLEAKGIKSVTSRVVNLSELSDNIDCKKMSDNMIKAFELVYGIKPNNVTNINSDTVLLLADKYRSWDYIYGKTLPFTFSCTEHFDWGNIQLQIQVEKGNVKNIKVYTDSMNWEIATTIENTLKNLPFEVTNICEAIQKNIPDSVGDNIVNMIKKQYNA